MPLLYSHTIVMKLTPSALSLTQRYYEVSELLKKVSLAPYEEFPYEVTTVSFMTKDNPSAEWSGIFSSVTKQMLDKGS